MHAQSAQPVLAVHSNHSQAVESIACHPEPQSYHPEGQDRQERTTKTSRSTEGNYSSTGHESGAARRPGCTRGSIDDLESVTTMVAELIREQHRHDYTAARKMRTRMQDRRTEGETAVGPDSTSMTPTNTA